METLRTRTWQGFERALNSVRTSHGVYRRELENGEVYTQKNKILFRGQANEKWGLETTLERKTQRKFEIFSYMRQALLAKSELESFTGQRWNAPAYSELEAEIQKYQDPFRVHLPAYEFLVYLRHHGYPSPLLDWTESPYIAAYFAYLNSGNQNPAVYCYIERPNRVKGGSGGEPMISVMGPFVSTHKRHFAQKATYTISTQWDYEREAHSFCPHEHVFSRNDERQDVLVKIVLSASARADALRRMSEYNINQFTLFQSEESLVKELEYKHFDPDEA